MNAKTLEKYRSQLQSLLDRIDSELGQLVETVRVDARAYGEHDRTVSEAADKELSLEQCEEHLRRQVLEALHRIDDKTFGVCASCGAPIDPARLDALPYARLCVACEQWRERTER